MIEFVVVNLSPVRKVWCGTVEEQIASKSPSKVESILKKVKHVFCSAMRGQVCATHFLVQEQHILEDSASDYRKKCVAHSIPMNRNSLTFFVGV